jgi:hypothetical protein
VVLGVRSGVRATGLLLLGGIFVPLTLAVLAPIIINILGFHLFPEPSGLPLPLVVLAAELTLAWSYRSAFAPMLHVRTPLPQKPAAAPPRPVRLAA